MNTSIKKITDSKNIKRGDLYFADLSPVRGSEQGGIRPIIVIQNNIGNKYSPTVIVAAITCQLDKPSLPTHVRIESAFSQLAKNSIVLMEQIRTIDCERLKKYIGHLDSGLMGSIDHALSVSVGL